MTTTVTMAAASAALVDKGESLDAAWEEACNAFKDAAGINLKSAKVPSAEDIRDKFDKKRSKDAEDHVKMNKAKDAFGKTVNLVQKVGSVAAQGASMVFGSPATIAQGALSVFIDAGLQYRNIFHNIEDILVRIVVVFERFQVYVENQGDLPIQMIRVANKLLVAVVNICGLCYKTLKRNKLKTFLDIALFSNDKGVQAQLARLTALEAEESQMKGTLSLVAAESTKRSVATGFAQTSEGLGKISANMQRMEAADKEEKDMKELKEKLSISKDASPQEEYRRYLDRLSEHSDSCAWLQEDTIYRSWVNDKDDQKQVLVLTGGEGFGKSFTATAIVNDLQNRFPQRQHNADRISVAYFYVTRGSKESAVASVSEILRMLIWQVAQNDLFYRKDVIGVCKGLTQLGSTQEIWKQFFIDCSENDATFYLTIDGIQELDEKEQDLLVELVKAVGSQPQNSRSIKLLLPARAAFANSLKAKCPGPLTILDLAEKNQTDLKTHIQSAADKMTIFQKQKQKVQDLKQEVCEGVAEAVKGSFLYADYLLREISGKYDPEEVRAIVERAKQSDGNLADSITDVIKQCNQTLSAKDLQDLNTLLLWIIFAEWGFDLGELESIIYLQRGEPSLKPLYNQIKENFSSFFTISPDEDAQFSTVLLKSDSIGDYFRNLSDELNSTVSNSTKALSKGEIKLVQNFIQKLCEQDTYDRLGLDKFFEQKLSETDTTIFVDCQNAHALIIIDCMKVLVGDADPEVEGLRNYAGRHLPTHLQQLDLDGIDPRYKAEIGPLLMKLFKHSEGIKEAYSGSWVPFWTYNDDLTREVVRLMRSSAVMKRVTAAGGEDKEWVTSVLESQTSWIDLLRPTAQFSIHEWMEADSANVTRGYFLSIFGIYNKIEHFKDPQNCERLGEMPDADEIPAHVVRDVFEWAKTWVDLDYTAVDSIRNLALTFRECDCLDEALELFKEALDISKDNLKVHANISQTYKFRSQKGSREWEKALYHGNLVVDATANGKDLFTAGDAQEILYIFRMLTAEWHRKIQQYDEATRIYRTILEGTADNFLVILELVITLCEQEQYSDVVSYLADVSEKFNADEQLPSFSNLMHYFAESDEYNARIVRAFRHAGELDKAKQIYEQAMKDAWKPADEHTGDTICVYATTMYNLAVIYHHHATTTEESSKAIQLWEDVLALEGDQASLYRPKYVSGQCLSPVYMALAIEAGRDTPVANEMVAKIQGLGNDAGEDFGDDGHGLPKTDIRSLVGRYFSAVGDKEQAQIFLKPNMEVGVKLLSDDDPDNDWQGYRKLGDAFLDFGDTKNAIAAWTMIVPNQGVEHFEHRTASITPVTTELGNEDGLPSVKVNGTTHGDTAEPGAMNGEAKAPDNDEDDLPVRPKLHRTSTSQLERKLQGPIAYHCDGDCETNWTYADNIWVCQECLDVQFDEPCLTQLRAGKLPKNICSPKHHFMHVPSFDPAWIDRVRRECVLVGDEEIPIKDWLASIKKEWGIDDNDGESENEGAKKD